jgi:two-component system sensor histidine kinase UhpB
MMASPVRGTHTDYNGFVNLKLYLLIRMTLMGVVCWLGVSIYLVGQSGRRAGEEITTVANQLQPMVAADVMRRWVSLDSDARRPDLGGAAARFPDPICLRYTALDGSNSDWGCNPSPASAGVPHWMARALSAIGPGHIALQRQISAYGLRAGTLRVESDDASLLRHQWRSVRELLGLAAAMLLTLEILAFWVIGRALRPTAEIIAAVEQLGEGFNEVQLPALRPREFTLIATGINRLAKRLADSYSARAQLTARLIRVQEDERRELAHELHEEFGQCVTALSAVSASLRHSVAAGDVLTEADVLLLETAVEQMLSSLRGMLQRMSPPPLERQGLRSALADLVAAWQIRLHGSPRVVIDSDLSADHMPNNEYALCVYRVVQECLSNVARHAPSSQTAIVHISQELHWLQVRVSNDLLGVPEPCGTSGTGMGLKLLGERVRSLHGVFSVEVSAVQFSVKAHLPMHTL